MSLGVLIIVLLVGAAGVCSALVLLAGVVAALAQDAKEIVEARCERADIEARLASREEALAYRDALGFENPRAARIGAEAEAFLAEVTR